MESTQQKGEAGLPNLIRKVLGSPHAEQVIKKQLIQLASQNLHVPEVTTALLEVLPLTKDKETKDCLLGFLSNLDTSRFTSLETLYSTLLDVFAKEQDRSVRTWLLDRLQYGLHQDTRLAPFFIELMQNPLLSEPERLAAQQAIAALPAVSEETVILALQRSVQSPAIIQNEAVALAERCAVWTETLIEALQPYLDVKIDHRIRFRILARLADARSLTSRYIPLLTQILRNDPDAGARDRALLALSRIRPWDASVMTQLFWSATQDGDEMVRSSAVALQKEMPEPGNEHLAALAALLATEHASGVRITLLDMLKPAMRIPEVRTAVADALAARPGVYDSEEFNRLIALLAPYAGREELVRERLLASIEGLPRVEQRRQVWQLLLPKVKTETVLEPVLRLFQRERDESIRADLFNQLKGLSVTRHAALVTVFCAELTEPASPFRETCAGILANAAESYPEIVTALEDVLQNDQERMLVRVCLDGYLRPGVVKQFDVLLSVVRNEVLDTDTRQRALDAIMQLTLDNSQQEELAAVLAGLKPSTLRT